MGRSTKWRVLGLVAALMLVAVACSNSKNTSTQPDETQAKTKEKGELQLTVPSPESSGSSEAASPAAATGTKAANGGSTVSGPGSPVSSPNPSATPTYYSPHRLTFTPPPGVEPPGPHPRGYKCNPYYPDPDVCIALDGDVNCTDIEYKNIAIHPAGDPHGLDTEAGRPRNSIGCEDL